MTADITPTECTCGYSVPLHPHEHIEGCPSYGVMWYPTPWPPVERYDTWNDLLVRSHDGSSETLSVCNECGAAVANTEQHDRWHDEVPNGSSVGDDA